MSFCIDYPKTKAGKTAWSRQYGLNAIYSGNHWSYRHDDADYWHMLTRSAMARAGIGKKPFGEAVTVRFCWNDGLDLDNHAYIGKMIVDAMKGFVIKDDSRRFVAEIVHRWHDGDCIRVEVEVTQ